MKSRMQTPLYKILSLYSGKQLYDILVPFLCQRSGSCCQQLGVSPTSLDIESIADYLGLEEEEVSARYLAKAASSKEVGEGYEWMKRWQPCPFLVPPAECLIYPVRPSGCRSYPVYTLLGPEDVDCPGFELMQKVVSVLGRGTPYEFHFPGGIKGRRPGPARIRKIIAKLEKANLPKEIIQELIRLNRWAHS
ncbi:MAG: YkgJ family cysteine cluster protein [Chloroflexi bacterium]|nr:YkgJ family cysteine cluster protein [Chloroflexota bacterium]